MGDGFNEQIHRFSLSKAMAEDLTCQSIKNSKTSILGPTGTGKSEAGLSLCIGGAKWVSRIKHQGDPDHWEDYFPYWDNIAIILEEEMLKLAEKQDPMGTFKFFDEIQEEANNSRDYNNPVNRLFNKLFVLYRPMRHGIVVTFQQIIMQDRQARYNSNYYVEMLPMRSDKYGVNYCKVKIGSQRSLDETDLMHYYFPFVDGVQYPLCVTLKAPKKVRDIYLKKRAENSKISSEKKAEEIKRSREIQRIKEDKTLNGDASLLKSKIQDALIDDPKLSGSSLARKFNCSEGYAKEIKRKLGFSAFGG
jgi:hypothetical protein